MMTKAWILTIASSLLLACGGHGNGGFEQGTGDASSSSGGSGSGNGSSDKGGSASSSGSMPSSSGSGASGGGSGTSIGGSTSSGGANGVVFRDAGGGVTWGYTVPASDMATPVTLTAQPFQVAAGAEVYMCEVFANPFNGVDTDIVKMHGVMSAGSHHFFLFNISWLEAAVEPPVGTIGNCAGKGLEFHPFPYLSQQPVWDVSYPGAADGSPMGYPFVGTNYLMINVHYLNATSQPIDAAVQITLYPANAGVVTTHVGTIFLNQTSLSVPANTPVSAPIDSSRVWGGDISLPATYNIFTSWQHMHRTALKFSASTNGTVFYTDTNWDSPNLFYHGPSMAEPTTATGSRSAIPMSNSQSITWDCTYYNDTANDLTFGDSAVSNVMCIYMAQYYPANPTAPDIIAVAQ
ncbi:MAG TPA: hypothetical protein VKU41_04180 [Polyangiaceae bacterium]|nr:hypothetical protein [Polyangiaceae bacterium]